VAKRRSAEVELGDGHDDVIAWYRDELAAPAAFPWAGTKWEPVRVGPTWQAVDGHWLLPEATIGWDVLGWCGTELQYRRGEPWRFTLEQARFLLWWYAVDESGRWVFRDGVLQRLKGWGKDPLVACLSYVEALGPCRVAYMVGDDPVATDCPTAWVQLPAVSLEQTKNTMRLMPGLLTPEARAFYGVQVGKELIHACGDERLIQAVTSSPTTLEGARSSAVFPNETQHWLANNDGHEMAAVIDRNAAKSADGAARRLAITNAFEPGEDSVAQHDREAYEAALAGRVVDQAMLYDSLEAAPEAPLTAEAAPEVVRSIRGDSVWLDVDRIVASILDPRNPPSRSRRFWYNQITATEDAWVTPQEWDALALDLLVPDRELITLGFDGSTTDDHSALIGCVVDSGHLFELGVWVPPKDGEVDRVAIDGTVRQTFDRFDVVGFYSDLHPWESYVDQWAEEFGPDLLAKASPRHAVAWDMRGRSKEAAAGVESLHAAIVDGTVSHCGSERMRQHFHNARRAPNRWGVTVRKEHRESSRKIDSVPAAMLARLARQDYLALPESRRRRKRTGGWAWGA